MDAFSLVARLTLDSSEYDKELGDAKTKAGGIGGVIKKGLGVAAKASAAAIAAGSAAVVGLTKSAVTAYADYEQLVGGVETLFKDSADEVQKYAAEAYKTAGMSANEYMETVTGFSASLLQSLGGDTAEAARVSDMAIRDMADNANKMGTSMDAISTAYAGFAKQNYTMLDNLKLGYGGTKSEMERLLADAEKFSGVHYDIDNLNDVYQAIHVVQEEMDITGTTAKEASQTISGSTAAMKSAWSNLVVALGDENANFDEVLDQFIESVITVGENIVPRVQQIIQGVGKLVTEGADKLIPIVVTTIIDNLPTLIESGVKLVAAIITGLIKAIPQLIQSIPEILKAIWNGLKAGWPEMKNAGQELVKMIGDGIKSLLSSALQWGKDLIDNFVGGIKAKISKVTDAVKGVANKVKSFLGFSEPEEGPLSNFHTYAPDMMKLFADGIKKNTNLVTDQIGKSFDFGDIYTAPAVSAGGNNTVSITVNPAPGMDEEQLADLVMVRMQDAVNRKAAAIA